MLLATAVLLLCCGNFDEPNPWVQQPPPRYNNAYHGHLTVRYGTLPQVHQWCGSNFAGACAMPTGASCTIILRKPNPWDNPGILASYRNHEIGHCNGWRH